MIQVGKDLNMSLKMPLKMPKIKSKAWALASIWCKHAFIKAFGKKDKAVKVESKEEEEEEPENESEEESDDKSPPINPEVNLHYHPNSVYPITIPIKVPSNYPAISKSKYICFTKDFNHSNFDKVSAALEESLGHVSWLHMLKGWMLCDKEDSLGFNGSSVWVHQSVWFMWWLWPISIRVLVESFCFEDIFKGQMRPYL